MIITEHLPRQNWEGLCRGWGEVIWVARLGAVLEEESESSPERLERAAPPVGVIARENQKIKQI